MAVADEVIVELKARTTEYDRRVAASEKQFVSSVDTMQKKALQAGASFDAIGASSQRAFAGITRDAPRAATAIRGAGVQVGNLGAQFQDIGVQLAAGSSPFTIIAQQVPQITMATGSLRGAVGGLASAFTNLLSPVGLASAAFILAGSVAIQYFSSLLDSGEKSAETLKREAQLIQQVTDKWGEALPALKAYADERQKLADTASIKEAAALAIEDTLAANIAKMNEFEVEIVDLRTKLQMIGADGGTINDVVNAFARFKAAVEGGGDAVLENRDLVDALARAHEATHIPAADALAKAVLAVRDAFAATAKEARTMGLEIDKALSPEAPRRFDESGFSVTPGSAPIPTTREKGLTDKSGYFDDPDPAVARAAARAAKEKTPSEKFQATVDEHRRRLEVMRAELAAQQDLANGYNDYGFSVARVREEQRLLVAAQAAGLEITPNLSAAIREAATSLAELEAQQKSTAAAQAELNKATQEYNEFTKGVLGGFISDLVQGKSAADALAGALGKVADKLLEIALNSLFDEGGPLAGFGKLLSGILGGGGGGGGGALSGGGAVAQVSSAISAAAPKAVVSGVGKAVDLAGSLLGLNETANTASINSFLKAGGIDINAAQTAWCAAFVNSSLKQIGIDGSGSLTANSFLNWGKGVDVGSIMKGDVLVQSRGLGANVPGGHVGFATGATQMGANGLQVGMLSGNLGGGKVGTSWIDAAQVDIRRATESITQLGTAASTAASTASQAAGTVGTMAEQAAAATEGLGTFGQGLTNLGSQLGGSTGGGGGILGFLGDIFGGLGGGTGSAIVSPRLGFDSGGYTGPGGRKQVAGAVHKGEIVWSQDDIARAGGVGVVEAMRRGRDYSDGGVVGGASMWQPKRRASGGDMPDISVVYSPVIDNRGASAEAVARLERLVVEERAALPARIVKTVHEARSQRVL